jgi:mercuric ion transport protein
MSERKLLATGIIGAAVAALCCFTPVLAILLGAVGLSAAIGHLDAVLLPAMIGFAALAIYALVRRSRR